jgi:hypothetical protein
VSTPLSRRGRRVGCRSALMVPMSRRCLGPRLPVLISPGRSCALRRRHSGHPEWNLQPIVPSSGGSHSPHVGEHDWGLLPNGRSGAGANPQRRRRRCRRGITAKRYCWWAVHAAPSQYRCLAGSAGSWYQPLGAATRMTRWESSVSWTRWLRSAPADCVTKSWNDDLSMDRTTAGVAATKVADCGAPVRARDGSQSRPGRGPPCGPRSRLRRR